MELTTLLNIVRLNNYLTLILFGCNNSTICLLKIKTKKNGFWIY